MKGKKRYRLLAFILLLILFRGQLFRLCAHYEPVGERTILVVNNQDLQREIAKWAAENSAASVEKRIAYSRKLTAKTASFIMRSASGQPDDVYVTGQANCVGYARLFAGILEEVNKAMGEERSISQAILVGELSLFGQSLHQLTNDPFWQDHDYNQVTDLKTGEVYFLDVTLYDYFGIRWVE
ncbi:hypothetical protein [Neolewinella persica]|uniref:hypothetical protein n=1 Tax=Neolewinella persica TaxID=70998 RepID=UPI0003634732|nr:hypothetical protein [Neolewinella persica]